jgi:hypothetical protein
MKALSIFIACLISLQVLTGCNYPEGSSLEAQKKETVSEKQNSASNIKPTSASSNNQSKHLNINVLIDLSNRIDSHRNKLSPSQIERDKAIIQLFCNAIKGNVTTNGSFKANARIKVFFHPQPQNDAIAQTAKKLTAVFHAGTSPESAKENKRLFSELDSSFTSGLNSLYSFALQDRKFPGSNIWRFMKEDVRNQCIENSPEFRNILVILSDGYMYYKNELNREGNRYSYIERTFDHFRRFRNPGLLKTDFEQQNFGFITANANLDNLEVLLLEVAPEDEYPQDFDIICKYWSKWLTEMGIKRFKICKTDLPVNTVRLVNNFLSVAGE